MPLETLFLSLEGLLVSEDQAQYHRQGKEGCIFCSSEIQSRILATNGSVFALKDKYPVTPGHLLVIPYRHTEDYFSMTQEERQDSEALLRVLRNKVLGEDKSVTGFNVGVNCGESAGQTVRC